MRQSTVSVRGQTVIPQEIREELGIKPKTRLAWTTRNGVMVVIPIPKDPIKASFGLLKGSGYTFQDFMDDRQKERELDKRRDARLDAQVRRAARKRKR